MRSGISLAFLATLAVPASAQQKPPTDYQRAIAAGYKAAMLCSGIFIAGRTEAQIAADELRGIYPEYDAIVPTLKATVNRHAGTVSVAWSNSLPPRYATWSRATGCTNAPIGEGEPIVIGRTPSRAPGTDPRPWPQGDGKIAPITPVDLARSVGRAFDRASYGRGSETVGVVIVRDGAIVAERYRDGFGPFTANRTWSVAKSLTGAIFGAAQHRGLTHVRTRASVPEWRRTGDPRGAITNDQLLRMASGLHSDTAGSRTDAIYFGGTAVTEQATGWPLTAGPGTRFRYANNDILLAMRGLRASIGEPAYAAAPRALFAKLGMTHTVAETDWQGNYILSSQVWSTARDLARFGQFMLQDGLWQGERLLPSRWMADSINPTGPQPTEGPGYGRTLWLFGPKQGLPAGSYAAQGNRGQFVMVIPSERLVIVRRGEDPGGAPFDIARFSADIASALD